MTGFGASEGTVLGGRLRIEIRTVNHRYFNAQVKLPFDLAAVEAELRERLRQLLDRGHVAVTARWLETPEAETTLSLDLVRARQVVAALKELKKKLRLKGEPDLAFVARQPEVLALGGNVKVDEQRLAVEIALLADRVDISEEVVRLRTHLAACREALEASVPVGKQLGFLAQELLREVNTIGSKANDAAITQAVIAMKGELERFREQLENRE